MLGNAKRYIRGVMVIGGLILSLSVSLGAQKVKKAVELPLSKAGRAGTVVNSVGVFHKQGGDSLYFYSSVNNDAIGLTNGGTYQAAIRLTPDELSPYAGYQIVEVYFYHHEGVPHSGRAIVYGAGTSTSPGDTLAVELYTANDSGWVSIPLTSPVMIDGTSDIWVSVEVTHNAGEYPIAVDAGPAVPGKGDWVYSDAIGPTWHELTEYNLNYNWNIGVVVERTGDSLDPLPPENLTAYSDYTTPTEIALSWDDPTHYFGGDTLTDFHIEIWMAGETKDTTLLDTVSAGVQQYTATGLTDGTLYTFLVRAVDVNDSTSPFASVSWYAGGSPYPAPPHDLTATVLDDSTVELTWINPSTQSDGTPLDDLAGINIYVDEILAETYATTDTGALVIYDVIVTPGRHTFYVTAIDNEDPVHESDPSNVVEVITNVHSGGPDGYGYTFIDSDHPDGPDFIWVDASVGTPYQLSDDDRVNVQLPFPFPFYEQTLTSINVVSNGFLTSSETNDFSNDPLPDNNKNNIIAPFWDDLNPGNGGTVYTYFDEQGTGAFVIEWESVPHWSSGGPYTFEILLYPNGDIAFSYLSMGDLLNSSTIGIQGGDGSNDYYLQYTYNGDPLEPHDSLTVMFYRPSYEHDVAVADILEPVGNYTVGENVTPAVDVANLGSNTETFDVITIITSSNFIYGDTVNVTVDPGDVLTVTFESFSVPEIGEYEVEVQAVLTSDENPNNNMATAHFYAFDYVEDFENTNGGFTADPATGAWEWGTPTSGPGAALSGVNVWGTMLAGGYINNADWKLYTPCYVATTDNPVFSFWHWYNMESHYDGGNVAISTDGGATWTLIVPEGGYPYDNVVGLGEPGFTGTTEDWEVATFNLDGITAGTNFCIRFRFGSDGSVTRDGWYIDDVAGIGILPAVEESPVHDNLSLSLLGSNVNPISSVSDIMFSVPRRTAVRIELYDAAGRLVSTLADGEFDAGVHSVRLDASRLTNGVYFVRMTADKFSAVRKLTVLK